MRIAIVVILALATTAAAGSSDGWSGEWVTDLGLLTLEENGGQVTGEYGKQGSLEGKASGKKLSFRWTNGNGSGTGEFVREKGPDAFTGSWESGKSGSGTWRGWRRDPEAKEAETADFSGTWLTSLGTMILEQEGKKITGTYGSQGWGSLEGTVHGGEADLTWKWLRWSGKSWLQMTEDGSRLFGMSLGDDPSKLLGIRITDFEEDVEPEPGEVVKGLSANHMCYFARAPKGWKKSRKTDAVVLLHGSNWTTAGMTWVTAKNWPDLADDMMILGIQGEKWVEFSDAESPRHNYTYVNWMGKSTYQGYPNTDRESPFLVHQVIEELKEEYNLGKIYLVGHSQGGFLAYILFMNYPEMFAGVAPMSCGLVIQAEPDVFDDEELRAAQRATPLAMVHGTRDAQWGPKSGDYNYARFVASGFPMLRSFTPPVGHGYDFLPVGEAVEWMRALSTDDKGDLEDFAEDAAKDKRWRDVAAALIRADAIGARNRLKRVEKKLDAAAERSARGLLEKVEENKDGRWIDDYLEWQDEFEFAPAGAELVEAYRKLQAEHDPKAEELIGQARQAFRAGNRAAGWEKYEEVVEKCYAAKQYRNVKRWLEDRD